MSGHWFIFATTREQVFAGIISIHFPDRLGGCWREIQDPFFRELPYDFYRSLIKIQIAF
jgi:hypothetical protein